MVVIMTITIYNLSPSVFALDAQVLY